MTWRGVTEFVEHTAADAAAEVWALEADGAGSEEGWPATRVLFAPRARPSVFADAMGSGDIRDGPKYLSESYDYPAESPQCAREGNGGY